MKQLVLVAVLLSTAWGAASAAVAPQLVNYQGVLRDADGVPREGPHAMVFEFYDAEAPCPAGGTLLLTDDHPVVPVTSGVFNVDLGGGTLTAGSVGSLAAVFVSNPSVYLQVKVEGEVLCPRTRILSSPYAVNAARESEGPLELFVHGTVGDDANDGLTLTTAKKTIMGAVRAMPAVLNGDVDIRIEPGTYNEEVVLSRRIRNGPYTIRLLQRTGNPETDTPTVIIQPPPAPGFGIGVTSFDEIVELVGLKIDDFDLEGGVVGSGGTYLGIINCVVSNCNGDAAAVGATDGHFVELHGTEIEGNDLGIESFDHGSVEVGSNVTLTSNTVAADAGRNSYILFSDAATCIFTGNGSMTVSGYSTIEGYGGGCGANAMCDPGANGSCFP